MYCNGIECFVSPSGGVDHDTCCEPCPTGQYQGVNDEGEKVCISCDAGQYQNGVGSTGCIRCVAGKYIDVIGSDAVSYTHLTLPTIYSV